MNVMQSLLKKYRKKVNKVIKGGSVLSILFALIISLIIPPFNIFASTSMTTSNVIGCNIVYQSHDSNSGTYNHIIGCNLDNDYMGDGYITFSYYLGSQTSTTTAQRYVTINGSYFEVVINTASQSINVNKSISVTSISSNSTFILKDYTDEKIMWNFPIESWTALRPMFYLGYEQVGFVNVYNYTYPIFVVPINNPVVNNIAMYKNTYTEVILYVEGQNIENVTQFAQYLPLSNANCTYSDYRQIAVFHGSPATRVHYVRIRNDTSSNQTVSITVAKELKVSAFYLRRSNDPNFGNSLEFALNFGLSNELLDNLRIIATGTTSSDQSSSDLENQKNSFDTTSNNLYTSENAFNTDMNSKLQSIDTSFNPSTSFGSKFLSSANWVRTQFDNITSTTPFGTVLSFSMLLGLSLLIIGKVFK